MKWIDLDAETRYRIVEMALTEKATPGELCKSFGMSRQTLYRAMEKARTAIMESVTPKSAGRPAKPESDLVIKALQKEKSVLEKEVDELKTKYEVARTLMKLERKYSRGEAPSGEGKKKNQRKTRKESQKKQKK